MPAVLYEKEGDGSVAVVTLNRPEVLNAYNVEMRDALFESLEAVRDDPDVRVMVLQGNGRAFCSGGDIREFGTAPSPVGAREVRWRRDVWGTLWRLRKLTVAAVHGVAVGGGFEMALLCDQCIAASDARFALPEVGLGMIPGVGGTQTAPRLVGLGWGMELVVAARWLDAKAAQQLGMVNKIVPPHRLRSEALRCARRLARLPANLVAALKHAVQDGVDCSLSEGLALEKRCLGVGRHPVRTRNESERE